MLGVAGLVAILTHISRVDPIASYRHGLMLIVAFFAAAGVTAAAFLARRPSVPAAPALAPAESGNREPATQAVTGGGS